MKVTEITLKGTEPLELRDDKIATIEREGCQGRDDCLSMRFGNGTELELAAAVDVSEQLKYPRVFSIEGSRDDTLLLFGGEKVYWIKAGGKITAELALFRRWTESEYWTSKIVEHGQMTILIYEAGVLVIDDSLRVVWHKPKLLNDEFISIEGGALKFLRDRVVWLMLLRDGSSSSLQK